MPSCNGGDRTAETDEAAAALAAVGIARAFGGVRVLRGVDLTVGHGEAVAIVGPNGAGKTTLLRILAGLMRPDAGHVSVLGERLGRGTLAARRALGLLSHQSLLYDDLTILENLAFAARLYGLPDPRRAAAMAAAEVGLEARGRELPRRLSRGLLQRAAIARALIHRPRVLLLDEPFTGLDTAAAQGLRGMLRERLSAGLAMVVVTHRVDEVEDLVRRIMVLADGRLACSDSH